MRLKKLIKMKRKWLGQRELQQYHLIVEILFQVEQKSNERGKIMMRLGVDEYCDAPVHDYFALFSISGRLGIIMAENRQKHSSIFYLV